MLSRDDWLDAALRVLAAEGSDAVRIDRLARDLGVTKGSFHHHFRGGDDLRTAILQRWTTTQLGLLDEIRPSLAGLATVPALEALVPVATERLDLGLERAVRAWAVHDAAARGALIAVDDARRDLLTELWSRTAPTPTARTAALLPYLVLVGAATVARPPAPDELAGLWHMLVQLAEHVASPGPAEPETS